MEKIMQLKNVRGAAPIVLLLYLIIREFFFFSSKFSSSVTQHDQHQISFVSQIFISAKPSYLVVFFTFNIIVVALLLGISAQLSSFSSSSSSSPEPSILSFIDSYDVLKSTKDEDYEVYNNDLMPQIVYVEYEEEKAEGHDHQSYDHDYCFYKQEEIITTDLDHQGHGQDDDQEEQKAEVLIISDEYCGYEDLMSEEDIYSELNDDDFNKRIEEFIDENNKKWRLELQNERLIYV